MNILRKIFVVSALLCGAGWLAKQLAIVLTDAAEKDVAIVGVLWGLGMLSFLIASGTGVALLLGRAPVWVRVVGGVAAVPVSFFSAMVALDTFVESVYTADGWFRDEVTLVIVAVVFGAIGATVAMKSSATRGGSRSAAAGQAQSPAWSSGDSLH